MARSRARNRLTVASAKPVILVGALNVGATTVSCPVPGTWAAGDEIGRFGFGSTVVVQ